jgi:hypothetical protein
MATYIGFLAPGLDGHVDGLGIGRNVFGNWNFSKM